MDISLLKREWFSNTRADLLSGSVVALALIPEAIAFSIIAGVDPKVGLYASFVLAVVTAFLGGRTALITGATGGMSLVIVLLVRDYGIEYVFVATIATGLLQILFGVLKLGKQLRYIPRAVMVGFVNAIGILIFWAQMAQLTNVPLAVYPITAAGLAIIYILPRFTKAVPSPLVAIVVLTAIKIIFDIDVPTVGDMGELPTALPSFVLPDISLSFETLQILLPFVLTLTVVGLLQSLLTSALLDELTDTPSNKNREAIAQGIANIATGFIGGMAGSAMIGQSVINIKSGGRKRLSTLMSGVLLLFFILVLNNWVEQIPMAALVAVMIMVSIGTVNWASLKNIKRIPRSETVVMITMVVITVSTSNLAIGVMIGIALSTVFFSRKIAQVIFVACSLDSTANQVTYSVTGQLFFLSVDDFFNAFDFDSIPENIVLDLTHAHIWDQAAVAALDKIVSKFRRQGADVKLLGLNDASTDLLNRLAIYSRV